MHKIGGPVHDLRHADTNAGCRGGAWTGIRDQSIKKELPTD